MKKRPLVYVASPYTHGDTAKNVIFQCGIFHRMRDDNAVVPIMPLWSHFQDEILPRPYEDWMDYDFALIERCDALIRLSAVHAESGYFQSESGGADREVEFMRKLGKPVFYEISGLYVWALSRFLNDSEKRLCDALSKQVDDPKNCLKAQQQEGRVQEPAR